MKQVNVKKLILPNIPYVFIALLATKVSEAVRLAPGSDASTKLLNIMTGLNTAFHSLVPSFHPIDLCVGVAAAIAIRLAVYIKGKNAKKFRKNLEYGSARWGNAEDIKPYVDPAFENNIILTQTERLTMNSRPKDPKTARNKNVLIVGGSGSGKTRFWLKPNLLQCTSKTYPTSFVVTDPKGDIVVSCGHALQKNGYQIKILNSLNFKKSMFILKILFAPLSLILSLFVWLCAGLLSCSGFVFKLASGLLSLLAIAVMITYSVKNGIILLVLAFLISPMGLPLLAVQGLDKLQDVNATMKNFIHS